MSFRRAFSPQERDGVGCPVGGEDLCASDRGREGRQSEPAPELDDARAAKRQRLDGSCEGEPARPQLGPVGQELLVLEGLLVDQRLGVGRSPQGQSPPGQLDCLLDQLHRRRVPHDRKTARMSSPPLVSAGRSAAGDPDGLLVLLHGRGADQHDLLPLADLLDPERRLLVVTPRGPLSLPPGGAHWYIVRQLGYPDPATFQPTFAAASAWLDGLVEESGLPWDRVALGGFSQGAVMSYALGLGSGRARPAALIALSGFMPTVPGFELDLAPPLPPIAIGHGTYDPVIGVEWGRRARETLEQSGGDVLYRESPCRTRSTPPSSTSCGPGCSRPWASSSNLGGAAARARPGSRPRRAARARPRRRPRSARRR